MEKIFVEAKYKKSILLPEKVVRNLEGKKIGLVTTVQFADQLTGIKKQLEESKVKVFLKKGKQKYAGQILGCDVSAGEKIKDRIDTFLYVGTGRFHPLGLAYKTGKAVYQYNPLSKLLAVVKESEIENYKKKIKGRLLKFHSSKKIGVMISTKPGQYFKVEKVKELEKRFPDKEFFVFLFETLNKEELENFPFIDCWLNTACPRIFEDFLDTKSYLINLEHLD